MNRTLSRFALLGLLVAGLGLAALFRDRIDGAALEIWIAGLGPAAPLVFIGVYALGTVLFLPGSVLTLAGGALFGPLWGTLYNLTGATLGAALAFLIARHVAADWVAKRTGGRLNRLVDGVESEGWRFVAFVRLVPLFPFNLLNYALGLTRIRFRHYVLASALCMLPGALAYTWFGHAGREAVTGSEGMIRNGLLALALLAAVAFLPRLVRRVRGASAATLDIPALQARLADGKTQVVDVRDKGDFDVGHIRGALNVPLPELEQRLDELAAWRERPLAVICRTDRRSAQAVEMLGRHGFGQVWLVREGMLRWVNEHLPVDRSAVGGDGHDDR